MSEFMPASEPGETLEQYLARVGVGSRLPSPEPEYVRRAAGLGAILLDLDRCQHGRHQGDDCFGCDGGRSVGNPLLPPGTVIGYDISGRPYTVPERGDRHDPAMWRTEVCADCAGRGGVGYDPCSSCMGTGRLPRGTTS